MFSIIIFGINLIGLKSLGIIILLVVDTHIYVVATALIYLTHYCVHVWFFSHFN